MALGLPIAVVAGWTLATPQKRSAEAIQPAGEGGLGAAPPAGRAVTPTPVSHTGYATQLPIQPIPTATTIFVTVPPSTVVVTAEPSPAKTVAPTVTEKETPSEPPQLTNPPVPTPTEITEPSDPPIPTESADPSASASATP